MSTTIIHTVGVIQLQRFCFSSKIRDHSIIVEFVVWMLKILKNNFHSEVQQIIDLVALCNSQNVCSKIFDFDSIFQKNPSICYE